jgi:hypothetical protein
MSDDEHMTIEERYKYLRGMKRRYAKEGRKERGQLLGEMMAVTGLHRKTLTRLMKAPLERQARQRQRGKSYGKAVEEAVKVVAESLDWICAERLQPCLGVMARNLVRHGEMTVTEEVLEKLDRISISTVRRMLAGIPRDRPRVVRRRPERANRLARAIPAGRIAWDEPQPGHFETDLVHHSGPSASGEYIHSLQMVDVALGWSERVAVLGRSYRVVADGYARISARLPYPVKEVHPDNGSEFLNDHVVAFWHNHHQHPALSRSRAWHKNDNRFVEQKNDSLVRAYLGHDRLDTVEQTWLLNHLYERMGLYYNFFQPVLRLSEKTVITNQTGHFVRVKRRFAAAQTPLDRLCATDILDPVQQDSLLTLRDSLNPRQLRREIYQLLDQLFALPNALPGLTQDVFLTLFQATDSLKGDDIPSVALSIE